MSGGRRKRGERNYAAQHGEAALIRQRDAALTFHWCCAEPKDGPHHPACSNRDRVDDTSKPHDGQEALL